MTKIRLDKYLADMNIGTRSGVKKVIRMGQVSVNHMIIKKPEMKVNISEDLIEVQGIPVVYEEMEYYMLNKPQGVVSAVTDSRDTTVVDLLHEKKRKDLFPVGRLDKDTEGLLIITNDGKLAHQLLAPGKHIDKKYFVIVNGYVTDEDVVKFAKGFEVDKELTAKSSVLEIIERDEETSKVYLTITEGKFHQVKRMFYAIGKPVRFLKRVSMGNLLLDDSLQTGEYRKLRENELFILCDRSH